MKKILLLFLATTSLTISAQANCPSDINLKAKGWVVYDSDFTYYYNQGLNWLNTDQDEFVKESSSKNTVIRSSVSRRFLRVSSFDHLGTPSELMIGDVVFLEDAFNETPAEIRWFDGNQKYVAYDKSQTPCATNLVPYVENSLY